MFPGPNRAVGGRGAWATGRELKGRGASMGEGEWGQEALGRSGRWARICGAGGPESWVQAGGMTVIGVPRTRSAARPVLAMRPQQAPVSGKVFIQRDCPAVAPAAGSDQVPRGAGEPGTQPGSRTCARPGRRRGLRVWEEPGTAGAWAGAVPGRVLVSKTRGREQEE